MRLRCREGDLALILREETGCEANIGRIVTVGGPLEVHPRHGPTWLIEPVSPEPWSYLAPTGDGVDIQPITFSDRIEHPDSWLLPLRQVDDDSFKLTGRQTRRKREYDPTVEVRHLATVGRNGD